MQAGVSNVAQSDAAAAAGSDSASSDNRENQPNEEQNLQGDARQELRRERSRRRGRRRGRRRRRGLQRARARERARREAHIAVADFAEDSGSSSDEGSDDDNLRNGSSSARSRSPVRHRSLDNDDFLRRGILGIAPLLASPYLQPTPCRVPNCDWTGPIESAARHARAAHEEAILWGPRQRLSVPLAFAAYTRYWRLIDAFDELFLVQFRRRAGGRRRLQAAVQLVGPASRAAAFLYILHMQVVETPEQNYPQSSSPPIQNSPPPPSATRFSLVLGQTSSTRVDLEPAMISLWSANNFSRPVTSVGTISPNMPVLLSECSVSSAGASAPRVLDLTLSIQKVEDQTVK